MQTLQRDRKFATAAEGLCEFWAPAAHLFDRRHGAAVKIEICGNLARQQRWIVAGDRVAHRAAENAAGACGANWRQRGRHRGARSGSVQQRLSAVAAVAAAAAEAAAAAAAVLATNGEQLAHNFFVALHRLQSGQLASSQSFGVYERSRLRAKSVDCRRRRPRRC